MAEVSAIEWTHATFNPWIGCTKVSPACDNCYAEKERAVTCLGVTWGAGQPRHRTSACTWKQPLAWNRKAAKEGRRMRVFCASLADVFDAEVPDEWRADLFALIAATPHLDWLLLTKRPKVMRDYADRAARCGEHWLADKGAPPVRWPLPNVWLGTTVENQAMAEARIPRLLATPAAVRFLSCEPLLGPVDLTRVVLGEMPVERCVDPRIERMRFTINALSGAPKSGIPGLDWVIAGGESGPKARPSHPDWFRSLRDQCADAGVPFLFKQWGEFAPEGLCSQGWRVALDGQHHADPLPNGIGRHPSRDGSCVMYRVGKKVAGRLLDGVLHDGYPHSAA
ncbi:protein gp37 [Azospirillum baldaniorum]|uniref:phage Gp37/Gp68 family protein n=1 Tax=Azospirillum baldaniorum TaxID=1064539 RepID=UPI0011A56BE1|nr:phage Gp37/Gp68 family protein [Azospirillum baldaniorum]TWA71944.1 protein gp37 [Azospirillum baldaniorum]